jgi:hypothetical protein
LAGTPSWSVEWFGDVSVTNIRLSIVNYATYIATALR